MKKRFIITIFLMFTAIINSSCGINDKTKPETREYIPDDQYAYSQIDASISGIDYNLCNYVVKNQTIYLVAAEHSGQYRKNHIYKAELDSLHAIEMNCDLKENEDIYWICAGYHGDFYYITDFSEDKTLYRIDTLNEDNDSIHDASSNNIAPDLKYISLDRVMEEGDELVDIVSNPEGELLLLCKDKLYKLDQDLIKFDAASYNHSYYLYDIATDRNGDIIGAFSENSAEGKTYVMRLSADVASWDEISTINNLHEDILVDAVVDEDEYDLYIKFDDGIYGYKETGEEPVKIMDFGQSCISEEEAEMISSLSKERFIGFSYDTGIYFLENDPSLAVEKKQIILACSDTNVINEVVKFNKKNSDYQIVIRDYSEYDDPEENISIDIAAGNAPDIVEYNQDLLDGGYLTDLSEYYSKNGIEKEIIDPVLKNMRKDGKMFYVAPFFDSNFFIIKKDYYETISSYNAGELIDYLNENNIEFQSDTNSLSTMAYLSNCGNDFIDYANQTCDFTSEDFKKILEYSKTYGKEEFEDFNEDKKHEMIKEFRDGKILLQTGFELQPEIIQYYKQLYGDDIVFASNFANIGNSEKITYPICLSIYKGSENKEESWEFLKTLMEKEFQAKNCSAHNPVRKDAMEHKYQNAKATESFTDDYGVDVEPISGEYKAFGYSVVRKPLTDEDIKVFEKYLDGLAQNDCESINRQVFDILIEESEAYFSRDIKLDKCVDRIQKRIGIYINE